MRTHLRLLWVLGAFVVLGVLSNGCGAQGTPGPGSAGATLRYDGAVTFQRGTP